MWRYTCPNQPGIELEFHSLTSLNENLSWHKEGCNYSNFVVLPCFEEHEIWDDGEPCDWPGCEIPYEKGVV